jgi:hypothetical protein
MDQTSCDSCGFTVATEVAEQEWTYAYECVFCDECIQEAKDEAADIGQSLAFR